MATAKKTKKSKTFASPKKVRDRSLATENYYTPSRQVLNIKQVMASSALDP